MHVRAHLLSLEACQLKVLAVLCILCRVGMIYLTPDAYHSWYKCHPKAPVNPQAPSGTLDDDDDNYMLPSHAYVPSHVSGVLGAGVEGQWLHACLVLRIVFINT